MPNDRAVEFLSLDEAIAIHDRLIERFGGPGGIRDLGLLESALYRPRTGYYKDVVEMAAALFESVLTNHPFVDGNKRAALFCADVFLRMNGRKIDLEPGRLTSSLSVHLRAVNAASPIHAVGCSPPLQSFQ